MPLNFFFFFTHNERAPLVLCPDVLCPRTSHALLHRGGLMIHCMAPVVGVTPVVVVGLGDVSDGRIACVPEEMPGFI